MKLFCQPAIINFLVLFSLVVNAENCNFISGDFIDELNSPKSIKEIVVEVPKSSKFNKNFAQTLLSKAGTSTKWIAPKFKKKFQANITINYYFGSCSYSGTVRQNGDFKDHLDLRDGKAYRSLHVVLSEGTIMNAVSFKLLLPNTRNGINEILGSIILRALNFISPETFEVKVDINGVKSTMLFQESARKELLERNLRREGPIFEGDESLKFSNWPQSIGLEGISLARMSNTNWFLKGQSSQKISLDAYNLLQRAYSDYSLNYYPNGDPHSIFPNSKETEDFQKFFVLMLAMRGEHGLRPHNRKFYYNSFDRKFEPIYYDGNLDFQYRISSNVFETNPEIFRHAFEDSFQFRELELITSKDFKNRIFKSFSDRVQMNSKDAEVFINDSLKNINNNLKLLNEYLVLTKLQSNEFSMKENNQNNYLEKVKNTTISQKHIIKLQTLHSGYEATLADGSLLELSAKELSKILGDNIYKESRFLLLPMNKNLKIIDEIYVKSLDYPLNGDAIISNNIELSIDYGKKKIVIKQFNSNDWLLFRNVNFDDWEIFFLGKSLPIFSENSQRFNSYGMTGCLNFYNSYFLSTNIKVSDGMCEDSVNFINSQGNVNNLSVTNSFADAIDLDFSNISFDSIAVKNAGNDCLDMSGGNYQVSLAYFENCSDKGISVGEKSFFSGADIEVSKSNIGISIKDSSKSMISNFKVLNVDVCAELFVKKQEFLGPKASFNSLACKGSFRVDPQSSLEM